MHWLGRLLLPLAFAVSTAMATTPAERELYAGNLAEALPLARSEAEADPADLDAQERYIDSLMTIGLYGLADQTYRARVEATPTADSWYLFGRVLVDPEEAERAYQMALEQDPHHARAYMGLGAVYRATDRLADAERAYAAALQQNPTLGEAWSGLVATRLAAGRPESALETARGAVSAAPRDADGYLAVATLSPADAVEVLTEAAVRAPSDPRVHAALAEAHLDKGNGAGALVAAEHALSISPSMADPALSMMFAEEMVAGTLDADGYHELLRLRLVEKDDPHAAIARYDALVTQYPDSSLPLMGRARMYVTVGDTDAAVADLGRAIGLDPHNQEAQAALGLVLANAGRTNEAIPMLARVVARREGDTALAIALARAQDAAGDRAAALETMEHLRELRPLHVMAALEHARLLAEDGDVQGAYELLLHLAGEVPDERLVLALAAASKDVGKTREAADLLDVLARSSGNPRWSEAAARLRGL